MSILLLLLAAGLLFMLFSRTRRQQREAATLQSRLAPGSEVMTGGGLFATVVEVEDSVVVLETAPGQRSRWDRRAVARIVSGAGDAADERQEQTSSQDAQPEDPDGDAPDRPGGPTDPP